MVAGNPMCMHVYTCATIPVLKAGHPGVPCYMYIHVYTFVCLGYGWVGYFTVLYFLFSDMYDRIELVRHVIFMYMTSSFGVCIYMRFFDI